jgi:hypothetical protein
MPLAAGQILLSSIDQLTVSDRDSDRQLAKNLDSGALKSCLRPCGARLENAWAKCNRMYGLSSSHTDRQYCAVDSLLSQPPQQTVQFARHAGEPPPRWFLFRRTRIQHHHHQNSLVYLNPHDLHRFLLSVEAAERTRKRLHTVTCYLLCSQGWRDTDWFKTRVPDQTQKRPRFIQSENRPLPSTLQQLTPTPPPIFIAMGWP